MGALLLIAVSLVSGVGLLLSLVWIFAGFWVLAMVTYLCDGCRNLGLLFWL